MKRRYLWWEHVKAHTSNWLYIQGIRWGDPHVAGFGNTPIPIRWVGGWLSNTLKRRGYW